MIHTALQVIKNDLNAFLKQQIESRESIVVLSGLMNNADGAFAVTTENRLICTLFNIEQERANLNAPTKGGSAMNPPFNLNLYVLLSAFYSPDNYVDALRTISFTIGFFQGKPVFTNSNTPELPRSIPKMVIEIVNMDLKDISNFWATLGAKQLPSILIKVRMLSIASDSIQEEVRRITSIDAPAKII